MLFFNFGVLFSLSDLNVFHNYNCGLLLLVLIFVLYGYGFLFIIGLGQKLNLSYKGVELACSSFPVLILVLQIIPSLYLLWKSNLFLESFLTLKVIAHQWYWTYEIGDGLGVDFDSYIKSLDTLVLGDFRFLEVDNRLLIPVSVPVRFVITSADVIHSWALPRFFFKLDAIAGLLSVFNTEFNQLGVFYGQCREICGANHSFIPVVVEVTSFNGFFNWLLNL